MDGFWTVFQKSPVGVVRIQKCVDEETETSPKIEPPQMLVAGFVSLTCQQAAMVLNMALGDALGINSKKVLYLNVIGKNGDLVLSDKPSVNAIKLSFKKDGDSFVAVDCVLSSLMATIGLKVSSKKRLLLTDVKALDKKACAMIFTNNPHGQWYGDIDDRYPFKISDVYSNKRPKNIGKIRSLLEEDD